MLWARKAGPLGEQDKSACIFNVEIQVVGLDGGFTPPFIPFFPIILFTIESADQCILKAFAVVTIRPESEAISLRRD